MGAGDRRSQATGGRKLSLLPLMLVRLAADGGGGGNPFKASTAIYSSSVGGFVDIGLLGPSPDICLLSLGSCVSIPPAEDSCPAWFKGHGCCDGQ